MDKVCTKCEILVKTALYETGYEDYCECQCTLDEDWKQELWVSKEHYYNG